MKLIIAFAFLVMVVVAQSDDFECDEAMAAAVQVES
jgi:hypothetical protein